MNPKISVVLPTYNAELFISESIDSILAQTYDNFELIIINDGSTDHSKEIILSKIDKRIVYIENKSNNGIVHALNKGLYYSKGDYIARMDADDISFKERLEEQINFIERYNSICALGTLITLNNVDIRKSFPQARKHELFKVLLLKANIMAHPTVMLNKKLLNKNNLYYDKRALFAEDYKLWTDIIINDLKVECLDDILHYHRIHKGQVSSKNQLIQQQTSLEIKLSYAKYFFRRIIENKETVYLGLITENKFESISLSEYKKLARDLIVENNQNSFFDKKIFINFIDRILLNIEKGRG